MSSVTDTEKSRARLFASRNGNPPCKHGSTGGFCAPCAYEASEAAHRRYWRAIDAQRAAEVCGRCGEAIAMGQPVAVVDGLTWRRGRIPICLSCLSPKVLRGTRLSPPATPEPCAGCGRDVYLGTTGRLGVVCSERCRTRVFNAHHSAKRKARRAQAREKTCEVCGEAFTASRRDAKTCSAACKQKVYREKRRNGVTR
jgi:predicted nucleic acid-binding Zn ribbon protein